MADSSSASVRTAAEAFLHTLRRRGVDCLYVGAGTDTAPVIEAYARQGESGLDFPKPVVAAHENLAVGMAHGYYMVTGRPQAIMLHVSVGAANAVCNIMNAARSQVPVFLAAGRTPLLEGGRFGARDNTVHWGQEMFDQAGMLREFTKWDYELRDARNVAQLVGRGLNVAMAQPRGPVYMTLPREVLADKVENFTDPALEAVPSDPHPDPAAVRRLAHALASAKLPVIMCTASGADACTSAQLVALADRFGIAVAESKPRYANFPGTHALHAGYNIASVLSQADALLFLEADVPWLPGKMRPREDAFVAHSGADPLFARYPVRNFRSDLSITAGCSVLLDALHAALEDIGAADSAAARRETALAFAKAERASAQAVIDADAARGGPISKAFLSTCLDEVQDEDSLVVSEYSAQREVMHRARAGGFFLLPNAGGLGWGLPAALGARQAQPGKTVYAVLGDGAYIFCNPAACHQAAAMHKLPVVTVVFNNGGWDAVQKTTMAIYPDTHTAAHYREHGFAPLASLSPLPDFEAYATASGGVGERVERREDLVPALRRAATAVREGKQALVHVIGK